MARTTPLPPRRSTAHAVLDSGGDLMRIGGLADALFAIVLTLLVLELRLPEAAYTSDGDLVAALLALLPVIYAYVLTFAVGSLHWIAHHRIVAALERYDRGLLMWNLVFLGTVSGLPFSSAVVGRNGNLFVGWTLYAANIVVIGVVLALLVHHAIRRRLFREEVPRATTSLLRLRALAAPTVFLLSIPIALLSTTAAELTPLLLFATNAVLMARFRSAETEGR